MDNENLNMNFMNAMHLLKNGAKVTRRAWNKFNTHCISKDKEGNLQAQMVLQRRASDTCAMYSMSHSYQPSVNDIFAEDWEILKTETGEY